MVGFFDPGIDTSEIILATPFTGVDFPLNMLEG
jgi:hypothetical protein